MKKFLVMSVVAAACCSNSYAGGFDMEPWELFLIAFGSTVLVFCIIPMCLIALFSLGVRVIRGFFGF